MTQHHIIFTAIMDETVKILYKHVELLFKNPHVIGLWRVFIKTLKDLKAQNIF